MARLILTILILFQLTGCDFIGSQVEEVLSPEQKGLAESIDFLKEKSPTLHTKLLKIEDEISNTEISLKKLDELHEQFPYGSGNQYQVINQAIGKWKNLRENLLNTHQKITDEVKTAYVLYKIDEIKGRNSFVKISNELISNADSALSEAATIRSTIEEVSQ